MTTLRAYQHFQLFPVQAWPSHHFWRAGIHDVTPNLPPSQQMVECLPRLSGSTCKTVFSVLFWLHFLPSSHPVFQVLVRKPFYFKWLQQLVGGNKETPFSMIVSCCFPLLFLLDVEWWHSSTSSGFQVEKSYLSHHH